MSTTANNDDIDFFSSDEPTASVDATPVIPESQLPPAKPAARPVKTVTPVIVDEPIDPTKQDAALVVLVKESKLEEDSAKQVLATFSPLVIRVRNWAAQIDQLVPKDREPTPEEAKVITETRKALVKIRTGAEKEKKRLKADALAFGRAIDGANNTLLDLITPLETKLKEAEEYAERKEAARKAALKSVRETEMAPYGMELSFYNLAEMPEEAYQQLLSTSKLAHEAKVAAAKKAEEERIAKEKAEAEERERIRVENERLRKEREEQERLIAEERKKAAAELAAKEEAARKEREEFERQRREAEAAQKAETDRLVKEAAAQIAAAEAKARAEREAAEAKARKEREEAEAKARAEREKAAAEAAKKQAELDRIAAELRAKQEEEERVRAEQEAARKAAEAAPEKEKLKAFAAAIRALEIPTLTTDAGKTLRAKIAEQNEKYASWVEKQGDELC